MFSRPLKLNLDLHRSAPAFACHLRAVRSAAEDAFSYRLGSLGVGTQTCVCGGGAAAAERAWSSPNVCEWWAAAAFLLCTLNLADEGRMAFIDGVFYGKWAVQKSVNVPQAFESLCAAEPVFLAQGFAGCHSNLTMCRALRHFYGRRRCLWTDSSSSRTWISSRANADAAARWLPLTAAGRMTCTRARANRVCSSNTHTLSWGLHRHAAAHACWSSSRGGRSAWWDECAESALCRGWEEAAPERPPSFILQAGSCSSSSVSGGKTSEDRKLFLPLRYGGQKQTKRCFTNSLNLSSSKISFGFHSFSLSVFLIYIYIF